MIEPLEKISVWETLQATEKPIVLYGMGDGADKILRICADKKIQVKGVFASDGFCREHIYKEFRVTTYSRAKELFGRMAVLLAFGTGRDEVLENIRKIDAEQELYAPDVPLCGGGVFDSSFFYQHQKELDEVYGMLADDLSKKTFENLIEYKISGKISYLMDCESSPEEAYRSVLKLGRKENYLDAGAYTGDTVREFLRYTGGYERIVALEPDLKNYARLLRSVEGMENVQCLPTAVYSQKGEIPFAQQAGRNSSFDSHAKDTADASSIDLILSGKPVTYIKLDVEGLEGEALLGAKQTIMQYKPKMLVSAYHKNEDMYTLPLLVKSMYAGYRLYIRHYKSLPAWDTNYYFVV